jgi:2-polyprenyl-6-methoxyphenol hydroxylase-like FAD-dependent oxidoreductase
VGLQPTIYESATELAREVGAGMGMYANGLRVLRDIDPALVRELRQNGQAFGSRRWERSDGSVVMEASEHVLASGDEDLEPFGIRRWKLQQVLYEAVQKAGIHVHFSHTLVNIKESNNNSSSEQGCHNHLAAPKTLLEFKNGSRVECDLVFAADKGKSTVRNTVVPEDETQLEYTGVTCLMGVAEGCGASGIAFPSSTASKCHAVYFPTAPASSAS